MQKQIKKDAIIILMIIEIGYFLRGHLPSMCYYTLHISNYIKYPSTYLFLFLDYLFLFFAVCLGIFDINNIKDFLKTFVLVQPLKFITDIFFSLIPDFMGSSWIYPLFNYYLLILNIILIHARFINNIKISKKKLFSLIKPIVFCISSIIFQYLFFLIPVIILFLNHKEILIDNTQIPFILLVIQFVLCSILQLIGGYLLVKCRISLIGETIIAKKKKHSLIIYAIILLSNFSLLLYSWINMPNTIIEIINFGF